MAERKPLILNPVTGELQQHKGTDTIFGLLPGEAAAKSADLAAEITARSSADTTLQSNIDAEATARANADTTLQNNIDAEATARANADTTLQSNITAEATARANADTTLQNNIDAEATARAAADTTLQNNINGKVSKAGDTMTGFLTLHADPTAALHAVTKQYVDSLAGGLSWQEPVTDVVTTNPSSGMTAGERYLNTTDGKIYTAVDATTVDAGVSPADGWAVFAQDDETGYVFNGTAWVQFTGTGQITAGLGLVKTGNRLDVELSATGGLHFTPDQVSETSTLSLKLPAGSGLTTDATGVYIGAGQVTNAMLANSSFTLNGGAGSASIALGSSASIVGDGTVVTTAVSGSTLTISVADASTTAKGVASFNSSHFSVAAGAVSLAADLEDLLNINTVGKADGDLLAWDSASSKWIAINQSVVAPDLALDDLTDVVITAAASGNVMYFNGTNWVNGAKGATSGVQAYSANLDGLSSLSGTGLVARTGANTFSELSLTAGSGISLSGSYNTTIGLSDTGVSAGSYDRVTVDVKGRVSAGGNFTAGAGVVIDRTVDMAPEVRLDTSGVTAGTYNSVTVDQYGRVTAATVTDDSSLLTIDTSGLSVGDAVYITGGGAAAAADNGASSTTHAIGVVAVVGGASVGKVATGGVASGFSGLTPGARYFLDAAGAITATVPSTAGDFVLSMGIAVSATKLAVQIGMPIEL